MEQMERYKRLIKFDVITVMPFVEIGLYYLFQAYYYNRVITIPFWRRGNQFMADLYGTMLFIFHNLYGGLEIGFSQKDSTIYSQLLAIPATNVFDYFLFALVKCYWYVPLPFVILTAADMILVLFWTSISRWTYNLLFPPWQFLLIYGKHSVAHILGKMNSRDDKCVLTVAIRIDVGIRRIIREVPKCGGVVIGDLGSHDRNPISKCCYKADKHIYMIPKINDVLIRNSGGLRFFDTVLLLSRNDGLQVDQLFCKRAFDILSVGALPVLSLPLFLLFAIATRSEDRGPISYKQYRLAEDGKILDILKFRTMRVNAETDGVARLAAQADDRITRVDKVLRAARLDELPQVLNILKGDMSMVGPRPERPEIAAEYKKEIPKFDYRFKVEAGLTGYAQIYGVYNMTPHDKLKLGLIYIRNYSIFLDLKLIFMTLKILFIKEKTEDVADGQVTAVQQTGNLSGELKF